jgi:8-oxo-dGTP pyrophosphatase MutT (NUDIX family)
MAELTPVPSATVILARSSPQGLEVLMMQRNLKSAFVPGMYLFPGGAVDKDDDTPGALELSTHLTDEEASRRLGVASGGLAYWVAAIRESFEEAGLLLAYDHGDHVISLDEKAAIERYCKHRDELNAGSCTMIDILKRERLALAADKLVYFSHWITPVSAPRRYDTRFFIAEAPTNQVPLHDNTETISHVWVRPREALERFRRDDFKMRFPTMRTLEEFAPYDSVNALMDAMRAKRHIPTILPRITKDGARLLPGDVGYDESFANQEHGKWKV